LWRLNFTSIINGGSKVEIIQQKTKNQIEERSFINYVTKGRRGRMVVKDFETKVLKQLKK
jgi:hypothetical protein